MINMDHSEKNIYCTWGPVKVMVDVAGTEFGPEGSREYGKLVQLLTFFERPRLGNEQTLW